MSSGDHGGDGGGERWMVSYADFITVMMVFFIVLYGMSELDKKKMAGVAAGIRAGFNMQTGGGNQIIPTPGVGDGVSVPPASGEGAGEGPKDPLQAIGEQLLVDFAQDHRFTVYTGDRGLTLSLVGSAAFDSGSADLKPEFLPLLDAIVAKLSGLTNDISIEGFTDSVPINNARFPSNWYLSVGRASSVRDYLEMGGIDPERMIVVGYGETRPLYDNATADGRSKNRRVDVVILRAKPVIDRGEPIQGSVR